MKVEYYDVLPEQYNTASQSELRDLHYSAEICNIASNLLDQVCDMPNSLQAFEELVAKSELCEECNNTTQDGISLARETLQDIVESNTPEGVDIRQKTFF